MADHRHRMRAGRFVVFLRNDASLLGTDSQDLKVIAGDDGAVDQISLIIAVEAGRDSAPGD